jgi:hypothetical protein
MNQALYAHMNNKRKMKKKKKVAGSSQPVSQSVISTKYGMGVLWHSGQHLTRPLSCATGEQTQDQQAQESTVSAA